MTNENLEEICEKLSSAMVRALQQARSVSDSEHYDHHTWVQQHIEKEKMRAQFYKDMIQHLAKWGSVSVVTGIFYAIWLLLKSEIHK